jgi:UDPglucose 6-dehydrogenase
MSQVPPGFTRRLGEQIRSRRPELKFSLYYWIETLIFGNAVERFLKPERIMLGCADPTAPLPAALDAALARFQSPVFRLRYESAELTKTAINLYLCAAVTYANTLADLCEAVGADWSEMMPPLQLDRRIGPAAYIRPGLGIAGGNLERDLVTLRELCRSGGIDSAFIDTLIDYNSRRHQWVHRKLDAHVFSAVSRPVLAVWGLAYKRNTRSTKNSMALRVIGDLRDRADVRAWDPVVGAGDVDVPVKVVGDAAEALDGADALLILTDWPEFATLSAEALRRMRRRVVIDCVGIVDAKRTDLRDVTYVTMGRAD